MNSVVLAFRKCVVAGIILACVGAASGITVTVDLTPGVGSSGSINGAIFLVEDNSTPSGSGIFDAFVRINPNGQQSTGQGYNTSGRPVPFDENNSPTFTHDNQLGEVSTRTIGTTTYYEFFLDISQPAGEGGTQYLSLDKVRIYTSPTPSQNTTAIDTLGPLRYTTTIGASIVLLDGQALGSGQGRFDMTMLVPVNNFAGALGTDYFYLYSAFGGAGVLGARDYGFDGGFAEWDHQVAVTTPPGTVPEPLTMLGVFAGATGLGGYLRRRLV